MPIRPENRQHYGPDWDELALQLKQDAGWQCQCTGECGRGHTDRCPERHGEHAVRGRRNHIVILTVAHLDHDPSHRDRARLRVMCQGCHLHYDIPHHWQTRMANQAAQLEQAGQLTLTL